MQKKFENEPYTKNEGRVLRNEAVVSTNDRFLRLTCLFPDYFTAWLLSTKKWPFSPPMQDQPIMLTGGSKQGRWR
jgi:hypothetical protein